MSAIASTGSYCECSNLESPFVLPGQRSPLALACFDAPSGLFFWWIRLGSSSFGFCGGALLFRRAKYAARAALQRSARPSLSKANRSTQQGARRWCQIAAGATRQSMIARTEPDPAVASLLGHKCCQLQLEDAGGRLAARFRRPHPSFQSGTISTHSGSQMLEMSSLLAEILSLLICVGSFVKSRCSAATFLGGSVPESPQIAKFPVKFRVSREFARRPMRSALRRQPARVVMPMLLMTHGGCWTRV